MGRIPGEFSNDARALLIVTYAVPIKLRKKRVVFCCKGVFFNSLHMHRFLKALTRFFCSNQFRL